MPIPTSVTDLDPSASNNSPLGSEPPTEGDNHIRALAAIVRQVYDAQSDYNSNVVSVTDEAFGAVGDGATDDTAAVQDCIDTVGANATIVFPAGKNYVIREPLSITNDGVTLLGYGATLTIGAGEAAGTRIIVVDANNFAAHGFHVVDGGTKTTAFGVVPASATVAGFAFTDMVFENCFYAVRLDGQSGILVTDAVIHNIRSTAPGGGEAASHILGDFTQRVTVSQCIVRYGTNSSQIGFADSTELTITGNICREVEDLDPSDASIQIEDSDLARAIISGNICDHDIWIDDSTDISIGPNIARRLRFTVTERSNTKIACVGGRYGRIQVTEYGTPGAFRTSARFSCMVLDPGGYTEDYGIFASGTYVADLRFSDIEMTSNGVLANVLCSREASAAYRFRGCDFNGGTVTFSSSGGTVSLRDNIDYITENSGNATITSAATSVVVTHGLSRQPAPQDVSVIGAENPTNDVGTIWVDTFTSTQFTVNCENAPGASDFTFGWRASVSRGL